jgi:hypothetical protein
MYPDLHVHCCDVHYVSLYKNFISLNFRKYGPLIINTKQNQKAFTEAILVRYLHTEGRRDSCTSALTKSSFCCILTTNETFVMDSSLNSA